MTAIQTRGAGPGTLASLIAEHIRRDIARAVFLPGQRLAVATLRDRYRVGASPIREALNRLSSEGVVTQEDQRGFWVPGINADDLADLTRTRCLLNEIVLREAIGRADDLSDAAIVVAFHRLHRIEPVLATEKFAVNPEWLEVHRSFHTALIASCGSRRLVDFETALALRAEQYVVLAGLHVTRLRTPRGKMRDVDAEHRHIMEAVLDRDVARAVRLFNEHITATTRIIDEYVAAQTAPKTKLPHRSRRGRAAVPDAVRGSAEADIGTD